MASFGKVDRYVSPTLWNTVPGTPARQLAGVQFTHTAMAPAGGSAPPADPRWPSDATDAPARRARAGGGPQRQPDDHRQRPRPAAGGGISPKPPGERVAHCFAGTPCRPAAALCDPLDDQSLYRRPQRRSGGPSGLPACHDPVAALSRPDRLRSAGAPGATGSDCPALQRTWPADAAR